MAWKTQQMRRLEKRVSFNIQLIRNSVDKMKQFQIAITVDEYISHVVRLSEFLDRRTGQSNIINKLQ